MKNSAVLSLVNETTEKVTVFDLTGCKRSWTDGGVNVYADNFVKSVPLVNTRELCRVLANIQRRITISGKKWFIETLRQGGYIKLAIVEHRAVLPVSTARASSRTIQKAYGRTNRSTVNGVHDSRTYVRSGF